MRTLNYLWGILFVCMLSVGLTSCGSDDGGLTPTPSEPIDISDIVGTWRCTFSVDIIEGTSVPSLMVGKLFTINENGTYSSTSPELGSSGTFTLVNNTITAHSAAGSFTILVRMMDGYMHWSGTSSDGNTFQYNLSKVTNMNEIEEIGNQ